MARRAVVTWVTDRGVLVAREPTPDDVRAHAAPLADAYNDAHNRAMMAHTEDFSPEDVVLHYASSTTGGARTFLLFVDGALAGDADLRNIAGGAAEIAILIGARSAQGNGLGTLFGAMLHVFAFRELGLARVYASIRRDNAASLRMFAKLGYRPDDGPAARAYAEDPDDAILSLAPPDLEATNARSARGSLSRITVAYA